MTLSAGDVSTDAAAVGEIGAEKGIEGRSLGRIAWTRLKRDKVAMASLVMILLIVGVAIFAPVITRLVGVDPFQTYRDTIDVNAGALPYGCIPGRDDGICTGNMSLSHPLGVEPGIGRDIFARLLYGARISLFIALSATVLSVVIGTILGALGGYLGGWVDSLISRVMDLILAFPQLLLLIALTPVITDFFVRVGLPAGNPARITYLVTILGLFGWPYFGRIVRGQVLSLREREFVEAARSLGASTSHIIFRQLLPNLWAPILVYSTLIIPTYIATEAALSFLGVGVIPPTPTWGNMLGDSVRLANAVPPYFFIPGLALFLVVLVFNLFGDGLRDVLDPKGNR